MCYGGAGDDSVTLLDSALVGRSVNLALGEGDNTVELAGTLLGSVQYCGGDGSDTVTIASGAAVAGNVTLRLGDGTNMVDHAGDIAGDLRVSSANPDDTVTIAPEASVGGTTELHLGDVAPPKHGRGHGRSDETRWQPQALRMSRRW